MKSLQTPENIPTIDTSCGSMKIPLPSPKKK